MGDLLCKHLSFIIRLVMEEVWYTGKKNDVIQWLTPADWEKKIPSASNGASKGFWGLPIRSYDRSVFGRSTIIGVI